MRESCALLVAVACACEARPATTHGVATAPVLSTPEPAATSVAPAAASAPPSALPAYDLKADIDARVADARSQFGAGAPIQIEAEVFVVVGTPGWGSAGLASSVRITHDALAGYFNNRFSTRPARPISVYLFPSSGPYDAYCKARFHEKACMSPYGFYKPDTREIIMNAGPGLGTLTHELVHPIMQTDFPDAPTWLDEGIASLFEQPLMPRAGEIHGGTNWRLPRLRAALASPTERDEARVERLFAMTDEQFRGGEERLHYATARYFCQWLDAQGKLWPFYRAWRDGWQGDRTGERAFREVVGKTPAEATSDWLRWLRTI